MNQCACSAYKNPSQFQSFQIKSFGSSKDGNFNRIYANANCFHNLLCANSIEFCIFMIRWATTKNYRKYLRAPLRQVNDFAIQNHYGDEVTFVLLLDNSLSDNLFFTVPLSLLSRNLVDAFLIPMQPSDQSNWFAFYSHILTFEHWRKVKNETLSCSSCVQLPTFGHQNW